MSAIGAYARALAVATSVAQPVATMAHLHVAERPLVFVPLALAGEANAPLAAMVGTSQRDPKLLVVPQPRNWDLRFGFARELAGVVLPYLDSLTERREPSRGEPCFADAPQILVPNPAGVEFTRLLGRFTRFRSTEGPYAVAPEVPILGRWLTFLAERAEHPGSASLVAVTKALALHWATGQSSIEDMNLAAIMAWIEPPAGLTGREAARLAEDPDRCPPAGPATDPAFDRKVLAPIIGAYDAAPPGSPGREQALTRMRSVLREQLEPTWRLVWRVVARLRALTPGVSVVDRWAEDRRRFTAFHEHVSQGGSPQPRRDGPTAAAARLRRSEQAKTAYDSARAFDDPLVMAEHRLAGEAFDGMVVAVERDRRVPNPQGNLVTRPLVTLATKDPVHLAPGTTVVAVTRRNQIGTVISVELDSGKTTVTLELRGGMGRAKVPAAGSVPAPGDSLCYSSVLADSVPPPALPAAEETPWTHGGPPERDAANEEAAREGCD